MTDVVEGISRDANGGPGTDDAAPVPRVLDLACGPGRVSARLLARIPEARCVAVDVDPVLLAIERGALDTADGRIAGVGANLRDQDWASALPEGVKFDAGLTTTALHWLGADALSPPGRRLSGQTACIHKYGYLVYVHS